MSYKNLTHTIRDILEGKQEDPNAQDLAKLKKVAKVKDEEKAEEKLDAMEALEHGAQSAAQYAKDTPGQSAGVEHDPIQHQHKAELAVDGVPLPGGEIKKPEMQKGIKEDVDPKTGYSKGDPKSRAAVEKKGYTHGENEDGDQHGEHRASHDGQHHYASFVSGRENEVHHYVHDEKSGKTHVFADYDKKPSGLNSKISASVQKAEKEHINENMNKCGEGEYWCNKDQKCKPIPKGMKVDKDGILMKEGKKNCGCGKDPCETYGKVEETVMISGKKEKTMAAIKRNMQKAVDKANKKLKEEAMHEALDNLIQAYGLQEAMSAAEREARRDAAKDKDIGHRKHDPADVDHVYKPEKKRGRGERDLPHIATQLRGVVDMGAKHSGVKFKDGSTKKVHPDHASSWLKKHDSAKPAQKLAMYKSHDSHGEFMKHK